MGGRQIHYVCVISFLSDNDDSDDHYNNDNKEDVTDKYNHDKRDHKKDNQNKDNRN